MGSVYIDPANRELQTKLVDSNRILSSVSAKRNLIDRERRRSQLTLKELEALSENTTTYRSVGKMFLFAPKQDIQNELSDYISKSEQDINNLSNQQKYLETQIKDAEKNIKELIVRKQ